MYGVKILLLPVARSADFSVRSASLRVRATEYPLPLLRKVTAGSNWPWLGVKLIPHRLVHGAPHP